MRRAFPRGVSILAVVLSALSLASLSHGQTPPRDRPDDQKQGNGIIRGRVVIADTETPVGNVPVLAPRVQVLGDEDASRTVAFAGRAVTDSAGGFELRELPPGRYALRAEVPRERAQLLSTTYGAKTEFQVGTLIDVERDTIVKDVVLRVRLAAAINGRVINEAGDPIAYARVSPWIARAGATEAGRVWPIRETDDLGRFRLFGLAPGEYLVKAETELYGMNPAGDEPSVRYLPAFYPSALSAEEAQKVLLAAGQEADVEIILRRGRTYRVTGTVLSSRGAPVARAHVTFQRDGGGYGVETKADGTFTASDLLPGEYTFRASTQDPRDPDVETEMSRTVAIDVQRDLEGLTLQTRRGSRVRGRVVLEMEGQPSFNDLHVMLMDPEQRHGGWISGPPTPVKEDGTFAVSRVFGPAVVRVTGTMEGRVKSIVYKGSDITDTPTEFADIQDPRELVVTMTDKGAQIAGTVTDDKGQPVKTAIVMLFAADEERWTAWAETTRQTQVNRSGRFRHKPLRPGKYLIVAMDLADWPILGVGMERRAVERLAAVATPVEVVENEIKEVSLTLAQLPPPGR